MNRKEDNRTIQEIKDENIQLLAKRDELWRSIKDFDKTSYHGAERVGKVISQINIKIARNKLAIALKNNPLENG